MRIIDGYKIAEDILENLSLKVQELKNTGINPHLGVFLVGNDRISVAYVEKKKEACQKIGLQFTLQEFPADISEEKLIKAVKEIPQREKLTGLIVQLPLPKHINTDRVLNSINPEIDVDCLNSVNLEKLSQKNNNLIPPTPGAILEIFKRHQVDLKTKKIVLIGLGRLVGQPLAKILLSQGINLKSCDRSTQDLSKFTSQADVIILATGQKDLISPDMVKKGVIIIDAGCTAEKNKICGDIDFKKFNEKAKLITPVPGGVGPITVVKLLENVVKLAKK